MDQITEERVFCLPDSEKLIHKKDSGKALRFAVIGICILLIMISLCAHMGIAAVFLEYAKDGERFQEDLAKAVLSSFQRQEAFCESEKAEIHSESAITELSPPNPPQKTEEPNPTTKSSVSRDLSTNNPNGFALKNETTYNPDLDILWNSPNPIEKTDKLYEKYTEDEPFVLIYHTHATESYNDTNDTGTFRSSDPERNMIAIGKTMADSLDARGIKTVHLTEMFDESSYNTAYHNSAAAVEDAIKSFPSLKYIIDIHRDSVTDEEGKCISADFTYKGETAAQMMFVVGTDEGGSGHAEWRNNLTTALHLQSRLCAAAPASMRPINLRKASFYQDKSAGALLVEIGTVGNTLEEAKRSAEIFAQALADYMTGTATP